MVVKIDDNSLNNEKMKRLETFWASESDSTDNK